MNGRWSLALALAIVFAATSSVAKPRLTAPEHAPLPADVPLRIAFGPCDRAGTTFVAGPRFDEADAGYQRGSDDASKDQDHLPFTPRGKVAITGSLAPEILGRVVRRNYNRFVRCYQMATNRQLAIGGTVRTHFDVAANGQVVHVSATGVDPALAHCVHTVISDIELAPGHAASVDYPFTFLPNHDYVGRDMRGGIGPPRQLSAIERAVPDLSAPSIIAGKADALTACIRARGEPSGVFVVDLVAELGVVKKVEEHGIDDAPFRSCVAAAVQDIANVPVADGLRCSVAFGSLDVTAMPTVAIDADDIVRGSQRVAKLSDLATAPSDDWSLAPLYAALQSELEQTTVDGVTSNLSGTIRPLDATPMKIVGRTVATIEATGRYFQLATSTNSTWRLLRPIEVPTPPVPIGYAQSWTHTVSSDPPRKNRIVLHVAKTRVELHRDSVTGPILAKTKWEAIDAKLAELARAKRPKGRPAAVIDIVVDDDMTYGDAVRAIDLVTQHGFDWSLVIPGLE